MFVAQEYRLKISRQLEISDLTERDFLILFNPDEIPPHIGIITGGGYYSLGAKGVKIGASVRKLIQLSATKKIPTLFLKFKENFDFSGVVNNFKKCKTLEFGDTCFAPIRSFFWNYNTEFQGITYIFELIPILEKLGMVEEILYLNFAEIPDDVILKSYTQREIDEAIRKIGKC